MADKSKKQVTGSLSGSASIRFTTSANASWWEPMPDEHPVYQAIGRVASKWAYYEWTLDNSIRALTGAGPMLTTAVTAQMMGAFPRLNAIKSLCAVRNLSKSVQDKINKLISNNHEPQDRRNRIIHDPWFFDPNSQKTGQFKGMAPKDKELKYGVKPVAAAFIDETLQQISERTTEAQVLYNKILSELPPSENHPMPSKRTTKGD
jgi:hypothetical protein